VVTNEVSILTPPHALILQCAVCAKDVIISTLVTILVANLLHTCRVELVSEDARLLNLTIAVNGGTNVTLLALVPDLIGASKASDPVNTWSSTTTVAWAAVVVISDGRSANQMAMRCAATAQIVRPSLGVLTWVLGVALANVGNLVHIDHLHEPCFVQLNVLFIAARARWRAWNGTRDGLEVNVQMPSAAGLIAAILASVRGVDAPCCVT
jgi:uncharacterized membrane protein YqaE (UPF0057 family)